MNKIKSLLFVLSILGLFGYVSIGTSKQVCADTAFSAWQYTEFASSGTAFTGIGRVKKLYASSATLDTAFSDYFILVDTPSANLGSMPNAIGDRAKSPALFYGSTGASNNSLMYEAMNYGDAGVLISSGAFIWKNSFSSGRARRVGVLWRK